MATASATFSPIHTTDQTLRLIQSGLQGALMPLLNSQTANGVVATYTVPAGGIQPGGTLIVPHKLGNAPKIVIPGLLLQAINAPVAPSAQGFATGYGAVKSNGIKLVGTSSTFQLTFTSGSGTSAITAGTLLMSFALPLSTPILLSSEYPVIAGYGAAPATAAECSALFGVAVGGTNKSGGSIQVYAATGFTPAPSTSYVISVSVPDLEIGDAVAELSLTTLPKLDPTKSIAMTVSEFLPGGLVLTFLLI